MPPRCLGGTTRQRSRCEANENETWSRTEQPGAPSVLSYLLPPPPPHGAQFQFQSNATYKFMLIHAQRDVSRAPEWILIFDYGKPLFISLEGLSLSVSVRLRLVLAISVVRWGC